MAQKRNPISLRLQTRLQGYEKRFASCWFTDAFFSQVCTNDLFLRLYYGHLLQKGGSWYGEVSESRIPESCISLQFLYRKCSILSIILDRRKEEYTTLSINTRGRQEDLSVSLQSGSTLSGIMTHEQTQDYNDGSAFNANKKQNNNLALWDLRADSTQKMYVNGASLVTCPNSCKLSEGAVYSSMANVFTGVSTQHKVDFSPYLGKNRLSCYLRTLNVLYLENNKHDKESDSYYNVDRKFSSLSLIESICNTYKEGKGEHDSFTHKKLFVNVKHNYKDLIFRENIEDSLHKHISHGSLAVEQLQGKERRAILDAFSSHWTSINMIRGVSAYQNVEFCLHSVALLYGQRFSFLKIKEAIFKKLACNPSVRGARLVCSGRQGGRSKSAMRAKKQSAILGRAALSLFSSRLAFASTNIDTTFGQIGVKLWICYK